jgi:hypothetical protein
MVICLEIIMSRLLFKKEILIYAFHLILLVTQSNRVPTAGYVARMCDKCSHAIFQLVDLRGRDHLGELDIDGRIMLKWILNKVWVCRMYSADWGCGLFRLARKDLSDSQILNGDCAPGKINYLGLLTKNILYLSAKLLCEIWGPHDADCEEYCLDGLWSGAACYVFTNDSEVLTSPIFSVE